MKFLRTADAFRLRRREGPYRFTQKQPPAFVSALRSVAAVDTAKNHLSRDFRCGSIFDFFNSIGAKRTFIQKTEYPNSRLISVARPIILSLIMTTPARRWRQIQRDVAWSYCDWLGHAHAGPMRQNQRLITLDLPNSRIRAGETAEAKAAGST
jgi:hypothetical protein